MIIWLKYLYLIVLTLSALSAGIAMKRGLPRHLKIFAVLLFYTCLVELSVACLQKYLPDGNLQLYNFFMLVEFLWYAYYFRRIIRFRIVKRSIDVFLFLYPVIWYFIVFFIYRVDEWNSLVFVLGATFTIYISILYCYQSFIAEEIIQYRYYSEFWIAVGLMIFYASATPYMGMFNLLTREYKELALLLKTFLRISNIIMYSLFLYAYVCQMISTRKSFQ